MMNLDFYYVAYELYGMEKNIIFQTMSQYRNWSWALEKLNDGFKAFKVISVQVKRI